MKAKIYNQKADKVGEVELPDSIFGIRWKPDLVHQVATGMLSNARKPVAHTKDRSDVRGGGKKPWRQKGTGRARHGSNRSPIWVGGGVTFGPRNEKKYTKKINKKMRLHALASVLSEKMRDGEVLFVDEFVFTEPKARQAGEVLRSLAKIEGFGNILNSKNAALLTLFERDRNVVKSFRNFGNLMAEEIRNINPVDLLTYKYVLIEKPKESLKVLEERIGK